MVDFEFFNPGDIVELIYGGISPSLIAAVKKGYFPPNGTRGRVLSYLDNNTYMIQWPDGTTKGDGQWYVIPDQVRRIFAFNRPSDDENQELDEFFAEF